jgi:hypothetical protein
MMVDLVGQIHEIYAKYKRIEIERWRFYQVIIAILAKLFNATIADKLEYYYNYSLSKSELFDSVIFPGNISLMIEAEVDRTFYLNSNETLSSNELSNKLPIFDLSNLEVTKGPSFREMVMLPIALTNSCVQLKGVQINQ